MLSFSGIKQKKLQNSFSTLSQTTTGENTKKNIQGEEIVLFESEAIKEGKYFLTLPYSVEISDIITQLTNAFSQQIIHLEEDQQGGKVILRGISQSKNKQYFINFLDCLGLCCLKYGLNGGSLHDTYNLISIFIKKQILNNRCLIIIQHQKYHDQHKSLFSSKIISKVHDELKKIHFHEKPIEGPIMNRYLAKDSLFRQQIQIKENVYSIFVYEKDKRWERFRRLYVLSEKAIQQKIKQYNALLTVTSATLPDNKSAPKKGNQLKTPSSLVQSLIYESQSLYRTLQNYYEKQIEQQHDIAFFQSMLGTIPHKQITLYAIEQILAFKYLDLIWDCYYKSTEQQCSLFNKNAAEINQKLNNIQCFDYLELREKYRLKKLSNPYNPSIQLLQQVPYSTSPRKSLLTIQKVFSSVKVDCLKYSKGKTQLSSMDDLLPVMIFVAARAQVKNFPAYVKLIDDYVRLKNVFQLQERIITTLYVAVQDITKKWNL